MSKDRQTSEPGGCECLGCGAIFIGGPEHDECGDCHTALVAEIERLRAELQYARDGLTKGRSRMREDLERHKPLVQAVEWLVEEGHMYPEDLARLRAALDGLRPNEKGNRPA